MGKADVARMSGRRLVRGGSPAGAAEVGMRVEKAVYRAMMIVGSWEAAVKRQRTCKFS